MEVSCRVDHPPKSQFGWQTFPWIIEVLMDENYRGPEMRGSSSITFTATWLTAAKKWVNLKICGKRQHWFSPGITKSVHTECQERGEQIVKGRSAWPTSSCGSIEGSGWKSGSDHHNHPSKLGLACLMPAERRFILSCLSPEKDVFWAGSNGSRAHPFVFAPIQIQIGSFRT